MWLIDKEECLMRLIDKVLNEAVHKHMHRQ